MSGEMEKLVNEKYKPSYKLAPVVGRHAGNWRRQFCCSYPTRRYHTRFTYTV